MKQGIHGGICNFDLGRPRTYLVLDFGRKRSIAVENAKETEAAV